jgi:hypothetical protein
MEYTLCMYGASGATYVGSIYLLCLAFWPLSLVHRCNTTWASKEQREERADRRLCRLCGIEILLNVYVGSPRQVLSTLNV